MMKEYKKKLGNHFSLSGNNRFYTINNVFHGLFFSMTFNGIVLLYKGYVNMGVDYSHWMEESKNNFRYYL